MEQDTLEINERDRQVLLSALASLEHDHIETGYAGDNSTIERLRQALSFPILEIPHPDHVEFRSREYRKLMHVLPAADSWRLSLSFSDRRYTLSAEVTADEEVWEFELARELKGSGRFLNLADADQAFFRQIAESMAARAPVDTQIIHEVVEIALPWTFMPDDHMSTRLEEWLMLHSGSNGEIIPAIHSTYCDLNSDEDLREKGYAGVLTEISGFSDEITEARRFIAILTEESKAGPAHAI
ncbi:hypothetical protein G6L37_04425 [Agrobacterium rubi]|nr:hypothetical protein [Agrobacterium rubi]NTF24598.1 hypothetical protein [Agrobacterium rubi]